MTSVQPQTEPSASQSSAELCLVLRHPAEARHLTQQQLGWLALGLRQDPRVSLEGLLESIETEDAQLWSVETEGGECRVLLVTRIVQYELCDCFEVQICAGVGLWSWLHLLPELEHHARELGCKYVELRGRPGWLRVLPQYSARGIALEKEL